MRPRAANYSASGPAKMKTVVDVFRRTCAQHHEKVALVGCDQVTYTWNEYYAAALRFAKSLLSVGLQPGDAVHIIGFNTPEWMVAHMGTLMAGGVSVGIYSPNHADACHYIAQDSDAKLAVCNGQEQLRKYLRTEDGVPTLVLYGENELPEEDVSCATQEVHLWADFLDFSAVVEDALVHGRWEALQVEDCCALIYTSGTTGPPKGVMISHRNAVWTAQLLVDLLGDLSHLDRLVSYLPLSHVAAQLLDVYCAVTIGASVHFAQPDALKGSLVATLRAVQPTLFFGVPRVWEKMREGLRRAAAQISSLKRQLGGWAKQKGAERCTLAQFGAGGGAPGGYGCAHNMVLGPIKRQLGLEQARACFTGAAPIDREVLEYFGSLDIPVYELYGQSECTGPHTLNYPGRWRLGSCGRTLLGAETRIDPQTQEILIRGPHVCLGYRGQPSPLREGGWLPTGDMGRVDDDGFLYITGRLKELLITAGGENVPPTLIEAALVRAMPWLSSCVVVGDRQKFLAVLLAVPHDKETGVLAPDVRAALALGEECVVSSVAFKACVDAGLVTANAEATSAAQTVKKWSLLPEELSLENGELTPTLKIRRPQVLERHDELLRSLYPDEQPS